MARGFWGASFVGGGPLFGEGSDGGGDGEGDGEDEDECDQSEPTETAPEPEGEDPEALEPESDDDAPASNQPQTNQRDAAENPGTDLHRPYIRNATRQSVEDAAPRTSDGRPIDPNTRQPIDGTPDLGYKTGNEFWREQEQAEGEGLTQQQFNDRMNDPSKYQLEDPSSNRSHRYEQP